MRSLVFWMLLFVASGFAADHKSPIIDVHMHANPVRVLGNPGDMFGPESITTQWPVPASDEAFMRESFAMMDRYNIVRVAIFGTSGMVEKWRVSAPVGRILWSIMFPYPGQALPDVEWLRKQYRDGRYGLMGEMEPTTVGLSLGDPSLERYFALAEEMSIPVEMHTGLTPPGTAYKCCPKFRVSLGTPLQLEEVLVRHPKLRLDLCHAGYPFLDETIAVMKQYPQVYADLGLIDWEIPRAEFYDYLQRMIAAGLGKRILFGSNPIIWPQAVDRAIDAIETAPFLTAEQRRDILCFNGARFLGLDATLCK